MISAKQTMSAKLSADVSRQVSGECPPPDNEPRKGMFLYVVSPPQLGGAGAFGVAVAIVGPAVILAAQLALVQRPLAKPHPPVDAAVV